LEVINVEEQKQSVRFNEYIQNLLEQRKNEVKKQDIINEVNERKGHGITSPTTESTTEDSRLLKEYMERANIFNISKRNEDLGRVLKLRRFFRLKRNQQVEIYSRWGKEPIYTEGKVSAIGRDFVMLTDLKSRIWIPYHAIESTNVPYGIPNFSNSHQNFIFDNDFKNKLINKFGETVAKRDILKQQFYEESLQTNLISWKDTWVEVFLKDEEKRVGKMTSVDKGVIKLSTFKKHEEVSLEEVQFIRTIRILTIWKQFIKIFARI
jgi:hypothetical protein